jgi:cell division septation protein DedD
VNGTRSRGAGELYERAGRQTSIALRGYSAVLVISDDPIAAAHVAIGLARAEAHHRRVVIGDLVGDLPPIQALVSGEDTHGIYDSFVFGASFEKILKEVEGSENLGILTSGTESPATAQIIGNPRWRRVASDFAVTDSLLLLVVAADAPNLAALAAQFDGVLLIGDLTLDEAPQSVLLARIQHPEEIPPPRTASPPVEQPIWRSRGVTIAVAAVVLLALALVFLRPGGFARPAAHSPDTVLVPDSPSRDVIPPPRSAPLLIANPDDSAAAAAFSVEILKANTAEAANFELQRHGAMMPAATISLVPIGDTESIWYTVYAGALSDSAQAERLLASLRRRRIVADSIGSVVRTPFALRVDSVPAQAAVSSKARELVQALAARGVAAYALSQRDGSARLYAGAFESPDQSSLAATALRVAGLTPVLEYRTGRIQ